MTTITAEALGLNLTITDELKQALKKGALFITTGGTTLRVEEVEPLTENGMTEAQERELLKRWKQAEADVKAGRCVTFTTKEEMLAHLESL